MASLCGRHVVFVLAGEVLGGAERGALDLACALRDEHGARVSVLAFDDRPGRGRRVAAELGITWSSASVPWTGGRTRRAVSLAGAARSLRAAHPDVLVSSTNLPNVVCGLTWRASGAATAVWRQCDVNGSTRFGERTFARALRGTPVVVTSAEHARAWLHDTYGLEHRRVRVIPTAVRLETPRETGPVWRERLGIPADRQVWCMIAHLHTGKDHATLLRAWRLVLDELGESAAPTLLLAGRDAGNEAVVKAQAFDLDLGGSVRFLGEVDDVAGLLDASDGAVFCSHRELLPRGILEPMAAGLPVVATDLPGTREALGEPDPALLAAPGDAERLASALVRLARDRPLRLRLGAENAQRCALRDGALSFEGAWADLLSEALVGRGAR